MAVIVDRFIEQANTQLVRTRATHLKNLRALVMSQLYPTNASNAKSLGKEHRNDPLTTLANTFTRYAQTQQTAYETGTSQTVGAGSTNLMERQVSNALSQVLGRAPGRTPESFISALNEAFPTTSNGKVSFTPSRSIVSLYAHHENGITPNQKGLIAAGLAGQLSAEQATLYRQTCIIAADALKVLEGLHPISPAADLDRVEALRALVRSEINSLVEEFGRLDEPRSQRVETYFDQLIGPNGHLFQLGERAFFNRRFQTPATLDEEAQIAGFELIKNYIRTLRHTWDDYKPKSKSIDYPMFSERLARASILLPVIAEGNLNFMSAMDSIGFTENERHSSATKFTTLGKCELDLPEITVNDLNEWLDRFASLEGPSILADSGHYGLEFVTDQADSLFWVIMPILACTKSISTLNLNSMPILAQALVHERVSWALDDLINQLKALADLAA